MKNISEEVASTLKGIFESQGTKEALEATKAAADNETGTFKVVITTENLDRYQEVIKMDGWDITHYLNNPVVLFGHDHQKLIGMATSVEVVDGKMVATGKFAPNALGQEIRGLYDAGFIKATSVGFIEKEREGNLITKAELLEFSFVSVPANPFALSLAMEKQLDISALVTKGFMDIIKEADTTVTLPVEVVVTPDAEPEAPADAEPPVEETVTETTVPEEKSFNTKAITPLVDQLKAVVTALEALSTEAPEREEEEPVVPTEDEKALDAFARKKVVQEAATILGAVLAEWRQKEAQS